jgi:uncharacterized phage protein (TIGR01671 family)
MVIKYNLQHTISKEFTYCIVGLDEMLDGKARVKLEKYLDHDWSVVDTCRSIGLPDKNRKSIFENDVVKCSFINDKNEFTTVTGVVRYSDNFCMFYIDDKDDYKFLFRKNYIIEIIGTIHDNIIKI